MNTRLVSLDYRVPACDMSLARFPVLIGHGSDVGIRLDDSSVANHHCQIERQGDRLVVRDLGSIHGTYINGSRVSEADLKPGDELGVGMMSFYVLRTRETIRTAEVGGRTE